MTFFETQQMNERFNESETVLIDNGSGLFQSIFRVRLQ